MELVDNMWNTTQEFLGVWPAKMLAFILAVVVGWIVARVVSGIVRKLVMLVDKRLNISNVMYNPFASKNGIDAKQLSGVVAKVTYWVVMLMVWAAAFDSLGIGEAGGPFQGLVGSFLAAVPGVAKAFLIGMFAWVLGSVLRYAVNKGINKLPIDEKLSSLEGQEEAVGHNGQAVADVAGAVAFFGTFVLAAPSIFGALGMPQLSAPLVGMVERITNYIPAIVAATIVIAFGYIVAKFAGIIVQRFLNKVGADEYANKHLFQKNTEYSASNILGKVVFGFVLLLAVVQGAEAAQLHSIRDFAIRALNFLPNLLLGGAIVVVGFMVAGWVRSQLTDKLSQENKFWARIAQIAVIAIFAIAASEEMGIASTLTMTAFTIILASGCLAAALAFGLGGRDAAKSFIDTRKNNVFWTKPTGGGGQPVHVSAPEKD